MWVRFKVSKEPAPGTSWNKLPIGLEVVACSGSYSTRERKYKFVAVANENQVFYTEHKGSKAILVMTPCGTTALWYPLDGLTRLDTRLVKVTFT